MSIGSWENTATACVADADAPVAIATAALTLERNSLVRVVVTHTVGNARGRKTLERILLSDASLRKAVENRKKNFVPLSKRRGGRIWTKWPNKPIFPLDAGTTATIRVTKQAERDLQSVTRFVEVKPINAQPVVDEGREHPTNGLTRRHKPDKLRKQTRQEIAIARMRAPIWDKPLCQPAVVPISDVDVKPSPLRIFFNGTIPADLDRQLNERRINDIFVDVEAALRDSVSDSEIIDFVDKIDRAITTGIVFKPVVVGPLPAAVHGLRRELTLKFIRVTRLKYDDYVEDRKKIRARLESNDFSI